MFPVSYLFQRRSLRIWACEEERGRTWDTGCGIGRFLHFSEFEPGRRSTVQGSRTTDPDLGSRHETEFGGEAPDGGILAHKIILYAVALPPISSFHSPRPPVLCFFSLYSLFPSCLLITSLHQFGFSYLS